MKVKKLKSIGGVLCFFLATAVLLSSCISDDFEYGGKTSQDDEVNVKFSLQMPASSSPGTYAITEIDENEVTTIDVLAFKPVAIDATHPSGYAFAYKAKATGSEIVNKPGYTKNEMKEFTVTLIKNGTPQNFVILANVRDQVDGLGDIAVGADKDALLQRLTYLNNGKWNANNDKADNASDKSFVPFPMWGEVSRLVDDTTTEITGGHVLRSIARLDVVLGDQVLADNNFLLDEIYIYNSKTKGFIVPNPANMAGGKATAATVPTSALDYAGWNNSTPLVYTVPASMRTAFERTVYLPEAQAVARDKSSEATCIVIGGTFGTNTHTTYYRVDFFKTDNRTYRDILRNHKYRANITKVEGSGYETPEDAFNSKSINMEFDVKEWDDGEMENVIFDKQYVLAVSQDKYSFFRNACTVEEPDNVLYVYTDYKTTTGVNSGWRIEKIVDAADPTTPVNWLTLTPNVGLADAKTKVILTYEENNTGKERSAIVWIAAGRMRYPVTVVQKISPRIHLSIVDPVTDAPVQELLFPIELLASPGQQSFKVNWAPKNADLAVLNTAVSSNPFPSGVLTGTPLTGTVPGGNGGTGTKTYDITPPAVIASELNGNPFLEKASKIDFTVTNGVSWETKSVFLRQVYFNLLVDKEESYLLDGSTYSIQVRSNAAWRIKKIEEEAPSQILALKPSDNLRVGTTGGYNTQPGDPLTFTVVKDRTFWGLVHVTFESTDSPQRFADKKVTLLFALPKVKLMGIAYDSNFAYSPTAERNYNGRSARTMLSTPANFGLQQNVSTVYSRGFDFVNINQTTGITDAQLTGYLAQKPDIIAIGYDLYINENQGKMYANYLKNGGVMVVLCEGNANGVRNLMRPVFNDNNIDQDRINGHGAIYKLSDVNDPILVGPFGDLRNLQWGEDASASCAALNVPASQIIAYSNGNSMSGWYSDPYNASVVTAFRHRTLNLFWIGDGGFISCDDYSSRVICPFVLDSNKRPIAKTFGITTQYSVYNSQMFANIMTWAITKTKQP